MRVFSREDFKSSTSLSEVKEGGSVIVNSIDSGRGLRSRLAELGIYPGEILKVVRNSRFGPVLVMVKDSTFMLGRGMAQKIFVK